MCAHDQPPNSSQIVTNAQDCWQACTTSNPPKPSGHIMRNATGFALPDTKTFPDMKALVRLGHSLGVKMGFYFDNCNCAETDHQKGLPVHYAQDVALTLALGFDAVKVDSCGNQRNMSEWAEQISQHGKQLTVENQS